MKLSRRAAIWRDKYLKEDVDRRRSGRFAPRMYRIQAMAVPAVVVVAIVGWTFFVLLGNVSGFHLSWWPWRDGRHVPATSRGDLVRDTLGAVALFGATLAAIYAYRKQRMDEAGGHRADAQDLSQRYQDAAQQLGHEKPAVRLAGVYAMARLADEWQAQRQTCVDVLCAYLRMPWDLDPASEEATGAEGQVRLTVWSLLRTHLQDQSGGSGTWSNLNLDFAGAHIYSMNLTGAVFDTPPNFGYAHFHGKANFDGVRFNAGAELGASKVRPKAYLQLPNIRLEGGDVHMFSVEIEQGGLVEVAPASLARGTTFHIYSSELEGQLSITIDARATGPGLMRLKVNAVVAGGWLYITGEPSTEPLPPLPRIDVDVGRIGSRGGVSIAKTLIEAEMIDWEVHRTEPEGRLVIIPLPSEDMLPGSV